MFTIGQTVTITSQPDPEQAPVTLTGTVSRIWRHGDITVQVPGRIAGTVRTFVRSPESVKAV